MSEDQNQGPAEVGSPDAGIELTGRERRLHLQAYEYWYGLLDGRRFPSISDMGRDQIDHFRPQSFLVDFPQRYGDPTLRFVGDHIMSEYAGEGDFVGISVNKVPVESILSRLSVHYMEVLSNRAPISFEAEFQNTRGVLISYRGILLPFSDDDVDIHFIMGILTWEEAEVLEKAKLGFGRSGMASSPAPSATVLAAPEPEDEGGTVEETKETAEEVPDETVSEAAVETPGAEVVPEVAPQDSAAVAGDIASEMVDALQRGRDRARSVGHVDARSRDRLYKVLADAMALYESAQKYPEAYQEMLAQAGIRQQARAPLTPVIKLIFGSQYDKTRITEYATALKYAIAQGQTSATVKSFISTHAGGIKGCVRQARLARRAARGDAQPDAFSQAVSKLKGAPALGSTPLSQILSEDDEFVLLLGRTRPGDRAVDIVAVLEEKDAPLEALLKRAARDLK